MSGEKLPDDKDDVPQPQTESSGAGGGREVRTAIGLGDGSDGGWYRPRELPSGPGRNEPVRHSHLKDIAIDVLSTSTSRNYEDLYVRLSGLFPEYGLTQEGLADALARMVLSAYTVAQYVPEIHALNELKCTCPYFSDQQFHRIIELAARNKPLIR